MLYLGPKALKANESNTSTTAKRSFAGVKVLSSLKRSFSVV